MAIRALWKGFITIAELSCPVALYAAATHNDRIAFRTVNRTTGHPVRREFHDRETGDVVPADAQVKGYEISPGEFVVLEPEEIAAVVPHGDKTLAIKAFIPCREVDEIYFDKPYYVAPSDAAAASTFAVVREGMRERKVAALAEAVLFRRVRTVLLRPHEDAIIGHTLNFDYEVRSADEAFDPVPDLPLEPEMIDLARHIIETKRGTFDPTAFHDRYEQALADLVKAKMQGKTISPPKAVQPTSRSELLEALRQSAGAPAARPAARPASGRKPAARRAAPRRKAS